MKKVEPPPWSRRGGPAARWEELRFKLRHQARSLRDKGLGGYLSWHRALLASRSRATRARRVHDRLTVQQLRESRKSDRIFIFGCGYSINDIESEEWQHLAQHDTMGFTMFARQRWIPMGYFLIRGGIEHQEGLHRNIEYAHFFADFLRGMPDAEATIYILQDEYLAHFANLVVAERLLPDRAKTFGYYNRRVAEDPEPDFAGGIQHGTGTLCDAIHIAYAAGWKEIVLVGVDLYDSRYFWLPPDKTDNALEGGAVQAAATTLRGIRYDEPHNTLNNGVVDLLGRWREVMGQEGVSLEVYNPRSALASVLPVYRQGPLHAFKS